MSNIDTREPLAPATGPGAASPRVRDLLARMTLEEKLAQLVGLWADADTVEDGTGTEDGTGAQAGTGDDGAVVAPMQDVMTTPGEPFEVFAEHGLGHLTRVFGTTPVEPADGRRALHEAQHWLATRTRLGIPAIAHEECLTGLSAWRAATFPTPLAWGAAFHPELVERMGAAIGQSMTALGVHQGLAPVLDVVRDPRWGRVEECIGEDPYLVGTLGTSYVRGLQREGIHATLKHFVGYSASRGGRNLAPVGIGPRELADVLMVPFEMAVRDGGVRSVMHSYAEIDGVPVAADRELLTGVLREQWGFDGTVVADYFGIAFLQTLHDVAADLGEAAAQALAAGIDVELPTGHAYRGPLREAVNAGRVPMAHVDRAVLRVLRQKEELGLLDADFSRAPAGEVDLDPAGHRAVAQQLAEESVVLLSNDGTLPLQQPARVAVVGPNADRSAALFGCYSFVNHVVVNHPGTPDGIAAPTVVEALRDHLPQVVHARGCAVDDDDRSGLDAAVAAAAAAQVAVVVVGDQAGLFGRGTVGEGCDRESLELPGVQRELVEAVLATGTPTVLVLLTGRPYAVGWALDRCAAVVQSFFPGEAGGHALARVLTGAVNPSGRLPVSLPSAAGGQPSTYLHPRLGGTTTVTSLDAAPRLPFGHGLSYTTFRREALTAAALEVPTDGVLDVTVRVTNTGERAGTDVVQLYGRDVIGSVTRPMAQLLGYQRVTLEPGASVAVRLQVPTTRLAFSDRRMRRVVEPGRVELWVGPACDARETQTAVDLVGPVHEVRPTDGRWTRTDTHPA